MTTRESKTKLRYKIKSKFEINKQTLTSRITKEKQWDCKSSTYDFSSRNKIKVIEINMLNDIQKQNRFTEFDLLIHEKEFLIKRKLERLKFTSEKQNCRLRN